MPWFHIGNISKSYGSKVPNTAETNMADKPFGSIRSSLANHAFFGVGMAVAVALA